MSAQKLNVLKTYFLILIFIATCYSETFLEQQKKAARFITAEKDKKYLVQELFTSKGLSFPNVEIFIRVFKNEENLELWARKVNTGKFILVRTYKICSNSGSLGPKRKQGDGQVPEGCYFIDKFNPYSNFYLSLGLNYPNESDKILGGKTNLGGDIFIHGDCVTIGCIPLTNYYIEELYYICVYAKNNGQFKIPVHIFPIKLDSVGMNKLKGYFTDPKLISFWQNLEQIYNKFETTHDQINYLIDSKGNYIVK
jgi:murein L,D-transpeptidase YafK